MGKKNEKFNDYKAFVEKFEPKHTTDDCYTPPEVYDVILEHVRAEYGIPEDTPIIRPFFPGGDYENHNYPEGCVVVDNPPFSILAKILDFYRAHNIRFFLFSPALTSIGCVVRREGLTFVNANAKIKYANGAVINTGFITNLSPDLFLATCPSLSKRIKLIQRIMNKKKKVRKLEFDPHVFCSKTAEKVSATDFTIRRDEMRPISGGSYFGGACIISSEKAAEARAAEAREKQRAEYIPLSHRDLESLDQLNKKTSDG